MTSQLALFAPASVVADPETTEAPRAPDPWAWRVDYVNTEWEDGLRAWLCHPEPGLWLCVAYDAEEAPPYTWAVERGGETVAEGVAMTRDGARDAARKASVTPDARGV